MDLRVTWQEFTTAFREYCIPVGVLNRKLTEFLDLKQESISVMDYVNKFNHLAQYAGIHVYTDEKKRDRFYHGLSCSLQKELYTGNYQTFGAMMNAAIAMEGLQRDSQAEWKRKLVITRSSSHPRLRRYRLSDGCPISLRMGYRFVSLSRPTRHLPLSTVHLLNRGNNSTRDSRFHLIRGRGTS